MPERPSSACCPVFFTHLGFNICVVVVLQQQRCSLGVILAGSDVQSRQPNFPLGVVLQQQGDDLVVALLERHGQRGEAILKGTGQKGDGGWLAPYG